MNNEIEVDRGEAAVKALAVMNSAYINEIKRAKYERKGIRIIEVSGKWLDDEDVSSTAGITIATAD